MKMAVGGILDGQGIGVWEDQQSTADGIPAGGRAMVTQSLKEQYLGR